LPHDVNFTLEKQVIIGIDLGTTFSVLAVNGRVELAAGYPEARYLEQCDVSIIPDPFGNYIIPSAVWEDPDQDGKLVIGQLAKDAADEGHCPVMFSKRNMGTNIEHAMEVRTLSAREAAREVLCFLKSIAEEALGQRIDRAVVTHPAYFDPAMKEETAKAAVDAGFDFDPEKHLLMEPTAAALAYTRTDSRDPLRMLTYDLGGGTFDVTVMERRKGVTTIKKFGGNRLLGGFNFDRELAYWLLRQLQDRGVRITLNEDVPEDRGKLARLLRVAEDAKIRLAGARTGKMPVHIKQQAIFADDAGHPINLTERITREQFVELIQDMLDETIQGQGGEGQTKGCNLILAEAGMTIDQIDEILLVGGSTYARWVADTIENAWGRQPQLFEPDMCVAAGAAIHATTLPEEIRGTTCRVELDAPNRTLLEVLTIRGQVLPVGTAPVPDDLRVLLKSPLGGALGPVPVDPAGSFCFADVDIQPDSTTTFGLTLADGDGRKVLDHQFEITQTPEQIAEAEGVLTVLPKPLSVEVLGGMKPLAEEGRTLPAHCEAELRRTNEEDTIVIQLFQEADPIGAVAIENVPREAPIGAKVELIVDISRNNRITGRAKVYTRKGAVAAEAPVDIRIPLMQVPDQKSLEAELAELEFERTERLDVERDTNARMALVAKGDKLVKEIEGLLDKSNARQEIWLKLRALRRLMNPPKDDMQPPCDHFERVVLRLREALSSKAADPQIQSHTKMVERLENEGRAALAKKDKKSWAQVNASLESLLRRLERPAREEGDRDVPPTPLQKLFAGMQMDQTRQALRAKEAELMQEGKFERLRNRIDRLREDIDTAETTIHQIDDNADAKAAQAQIQLVFFQKVKIIEDQIPTLGVDVK